MAFEKKIKLYNGLDVSYHRIEELSVGMDGVTCKAVVGSYIDSNHRGRVFFPSFRSEYTFFKLTDDIFADAYNTLKKHNDWKDAKDI